MPHKRVQNILSTLLILLSISITSLASAQSDATNNAQLFLGAKALDKYWEPADEQDEFGILADFHEDSWPVGIAIGYFRAKGESDPAGFMETKTTELQIGIKKVWNNSNTVHFSLGGGLTFASLEASIPVLSITEDDSGIGIWLSGAIYWTIGENFDIGLQAMSSAAEGEYVSGTETAEIGGGHFGFTVGTHW